MEPGAIIAIAVGVLVVLGGVLAVGAMRRRDTAVATGELSRETPPARSRQGRAAGRPPRQRCRPAATSSGPPCSSSPDNLPAVRADRVPVPYIPPDPESIGVTRRQFLNRGIVNMMALAIGGFGAASIAFLWPSSAGGFGSKITLPDKLDDILSLIDATKQPYYYATGRVYIQPYPKAAVPKAQEGLHGRRARGHGARRRRDLPEVRAPRLPSAVVCDVAVVRVPVPRLAVQPGRREARRPGSAAGSTAFPCRSTGRRSPSTPDS